MTEDRWERSAPLAGVIYAVLLVVGMVLITFDQVDEMSDAELVAHYADGGNRSLEIAGAVLIIVGVAFLLLFVNTLGSRLRAVEGAHGHLSGLAVSAGVAAGPLLITAATLWASTSFAIEAVDRFSVDPNLARFSIASAYVIMIGAVVTQVALIAATSVLALRTDVFPSWLGWLGIVAIVVALIEMLLLPVFTIPVWTAIVSVVMASQGGHVAAVQRGGATSTAGTT